MNNPATRAEDLLLYYNPQAKTYRIRENSMLSQFVAWLVQTIGSMGYSGIVALMFLESSFFPFPSEVVVPPAGYLASKGEMHLGLVIVAAIFGSILGALFNYWIAFHFGRAFFRRYGKFFFVSETTLDKADLFFARHGHISTFIGRLLPGIRQYISLPAGIAQMDITVFCIFTAIGSGIWVIILAAAGFWIGNNEALIGKFLHEATIALLIICAVLTVAYIFWYRRHRKRSA
jgi:membrane protein DedA with SNARE-associated domain